MPVSPTLPQRVAPTLHDDQGAAAIARLLSRSRGAPTLVRLVAVVGRIALAAATAVAAWPHVWSRVARFLPASMSESFVQAALLLVFAMSISVLLFRITSRRFVQPLRARAS